MLALKTIAVLGAGHGGQASAADLTLRGYAVRLFSRSEQALGPIRERGGIELDGAAGAGFAQLELITNDLGEAVTSADLVELVVPTTAHDFYAAALAPILNDGQPVFLNPGHTGGGLHFVAELRRHGFVGQIRTCEVATLTYGCRRQLPGHVRIFNVVTALPFAAFPGRYADELFELVRQIYPNIVLKRNVLETAFSNINAVEHPPQTLLNVGWLEHTKGDYEFYYEGTTPGVGRVIDAVDREKMNVARALGIDAKPFVERFYETGYTTAHALEVGTAYQALHESEPNRHVKGPPTLDHRYINEDVGQGLVPWAALGDLVGVDTLTMDHLIGLASVVNERNYASEGLTLERMGLSGVALGDLERFLRDGELVGRTAVDART